MSVGPCRTALFAAAISIVENWLRKRLLSNGKVALSLPVEMARARCWAAKGEHPLAIDVLAR
jgi:hypothetical protein